MRIVLSSTSVDVGSCPFFSVVGLEPLRESWVLTTVSVSVLERRGAAPASFSGMRGVTALLLVAVGAVEVSMLEDDEYEGDGEGKGEG